VADGNVARIQVRDHTGAVVWSEDERGERGLGASAIDVGVDAEGFVHALVQETVTSVLSENGATFDSRLVVLRYGPDGSHRWRWERDHPPAEPWQAYSPTGVLSLDEGSSRVVAMAFDEPIVSIELDRFGNVIEEHPLDAPEDLSTYDARVSLAGARTCVVSSRDSSNGAVWVGSFDEHGALVWADEFGSNDDDPTVVVAAADGGAYLSWITRLPNGRELQLRRYDADGAQIWTLPLSPSAVGNAWSAGALDCAGNLLLAGERHSDPWVAAFDPDGTELWTGTIVFDPPYSYGSANCVAATAEGEVVVVGSYYADPDHVPWLGRFASR
jgi:hypothetical protein